MKRTPHRLAVQISTLLLALLIVVPVVIHWRAVQQDHLNHALIAAIKANDTHTVLSALALGADANTRDALYDRASWWDSLLRAWHGNPTPPAPSPTALLVMLESRPVTVTEQNEIYRVFDKAPMNPEVVDALLEHGARADVVGIDPQMPLAPATPLSLAISAHYPDAIIQRLLAQGADPVYTYQGRSVDGYRPLLINAVMQGYHADTIRALIARGAPVHARDSFGMTPLIAAAHMAKSAGVVRVLLQSGADTLARDACKMTAIEYASALQGRNLQIYQLLKQAKTRP
jgi:hypothetical protein